MDAYDMALGSCIRVGFWCLMERLFINHSWLLVRVVCLSYTQTLTHWAHKLYISKWPPYSDILRNSWKSNEGAEIPITEKHYRYFACYSRPMYINSSDCRIMYTDFCLFCGHKDNFWLNIQATLFNRMKGLRTEVQ